MVWLWFLNAKHRRATNFVNSFTAASTPLPSASHGRFPSIALRRHQVCRWFPYTVCVLPPTEASASVSTSLSTSSSFPPSPVYVPTRWGLRGVVHASAFRVIASHIMSSMHSGEFWLQNSLEECTATVPYLLLSLLIALVRVSATSRDFRFWPSRDAARYYVLHAGNVLCVMTPSARNFQST